MVNAALRAFDGRPPPFILRHLPLVAGGGRAYTKDDILELQRQRAGAEAAQDGPSSLAGPLPASEPETAVCEPPVAFAPGVGARLHREIAQLMAERHVQVEAQPLLPLAPPSDGPVLIRGIASRTEIDEMRTMLTPFALTWDALPPILLRHGEVAGECLSLEYSSSGTELIVTARIDLEEARRMPALSINFLPEAYTFHDGAFWHFRVSKARLVECSVTDRPCLRSALIERRCPAPPPVEDVRYRALANNIARLKLAVAA
jgi:hypothetical protein